MMQIIKKKENALSPYLEYCSEKGDSCQNGRQPTSLILKAKYFIREMIRENIGG
jgi:hypothetical protein